MRYAKVIIIQKSISLTGCVLFLAAYWLMPKGCAAGICLYIASLISAAYALSLLPLPEMLIETKEQYLMNHVFCGITLNLAFGLDMVALIVVTGHSTDLHAAQVAFTMTTITLVMCYVQITNHCIFRALMDKKFKETDKHMEEACTALQQKLLDMTSKDKTKH